MVDSSSESENDIARAKKAKFASCGARGIKAMNENAEEIMRIAKQTCESIFQSEEESRARKKNARDTDDQRVPTAVDAGKDLSTSGTTSKYSSKSTIPAGTRLKLEPVKSVDKPAAITAQQATSSKTRKKNARDTDDQRLPKAIDAGKDLSTSGTTSKCSSKSIIPARTPLHLKPVRSVDKPAAITAQQATSSKTRKRTTSDDEFDAELSSSTSSKYFTKAAILDRTPLKLKPTKRVKFPSVPEDVIVIGESDDDEPKPL